MAAKILLIAMQANKALSSSNVCDMNRPSQTKFDRIKFERRRQSEGDLHGIKSWSSSYDNPCIKK